MNTATISQARALRDRRANERMPEAKRLQIDVDDARLGGRRNSIEIQVCSGDGAAGPQDLADCASVVDRGNKQD